MAAWVLWLVLAGVLGVGEVLTLTVVLGLTAVAALLAMLVALLGAPVVVQLAGFAGAEIALLLAVRPLGRRQRRTGTAYRSGIEALEGRSGVVLERVHPDGGQVRIGGEVWTARPWDDTFTIEPGARVGVLRIEGATALVYQLEQP